MVGSAGSDTARHCFFLLRLIYEFPQQGCERQHADPKPEHRPLGPWLACWLSGCCSSEYTIQLRCRDSNGNRRGWVELRLYIGRRPAAVALFRLVTSTFSTAS